MEVDIKRWLYEGNRAATDELTEGELSRVRNQIASLSRLHDSIEPWENSPRFRISEPLARILALCN
jgi:hypothetical protein